MAQMFKGRHKEGFTQHSSSDPLLITMIFFYPPIILGMLHEHKENGGKTENEIYNTVG